MSQTTPQLSEPQLSSFKEDGFLIVRDALPPEETKALQAWAQEVHDLPRTKDVPWMPYEEVNARGERVLCRTENFIPYHRGFTSLLRGPKLLDLLAQLSSQPMLLFKEKINYKLSGSGGFAPHIDATAYTHVKIIKHLTVLIAVDATDMSNGGLEVVPKSHEMDVPISPEDNCIEKGWVKEKEWVPVELQAGEMLVFGSYLAHRSGPNRSEKDRKAIYATYNLASEGDLHDPYYADRAVKWPATHMREEGEKYEAGALTYGFGSPMLTVG